MVCPECQQGKHQNCDGIAYLDEDDKFIDCDCDDDAPHPLSDSPAHIDEELDEDEERIVKWEGQS